jgi:DNA-binding FadR family transcriptional regulator
MPRHAVEPRHLYRQIADRLRALIRDGHYAVGSRLLAAIAAHHPEAAHAAMHVHLQRSQARYADAWPERHAAPAPPHACF